MFELAQIPIYMQSTCGSDVFIATERSPTGFFTICRSIETEKGVADENTSIIKRYGAPIGQRSNRLTAPQKKWQMRVGNH
jgi:hypothetical protein